MRQLTLAIYCEGPTDERFLPIIIQRTGDRIMRKNENALKPVEVLEPLPLRPHSEAQDPAQRILSVARQARGYHALIIHSDADSSTREDALEQRYIPGEHLVEQNQNGVCKNMLPIIPVRMTEAWMMADFDTFQDVVGTDLPFDKLGFPNTTHQVESVEDPKHQLRLALKRVFSARRRRKKVRLGQYYESLARRIKLEELGKVPAFQEFITDFTDTLKSLRFIEDND
ncbi:MAG: DUF4276 family protein [bacterium]